MQLNHHVNLFVGGNFARHFMVIHNATIIAMGIFCDQKLGTSWVDSNLPLSNHTNLHVPDSVMYVSIFEWSLVVPSEVVSST